MTTVHVHLTHADTVAGENTAVSGVLRWRPTRRRTVGDEVVIPTPFEVTLIDGEWSGDIDATSSDWCWKVEERLTPSAGTTRRYLAVPASGSTVEYGDLVEVDPATLDPAVEPEAAWTVALNAEIAARESGDFSLESPDGTAYRLVVANDGTLSTEAV